MLTMEVIGPLGETLAMRAGKIADIRVDWDSERSVATFDSADYQGAELEAVVIDALSGIEPEWREHLRIAA